MNQKPTDLGIPIDSERSKTALTPRQQQIIRLFVEQDLTIEQTARRLKIKPATVREHRGNIESRTNIHNAAYLPRMYWAAEGTRL